VSGRASVSRETGRRRIAILGTGTEVGKTHASVALVSALAARGEQVSGVKPIESGVVSGVATDADRLARVSTVAVTPAPYRFSEPISPHLAARRSGGIISLAVVTEWLDHQEARVLIVETAGAVLSPLGAGLTNLDLVRAMVPTAVVLVGLDRLGILHEVASCLLVLRSLAPQLPLPLVVLNEPSTPDASTGTNVAELIALETVGRAVVFPRMDPTAPGSACIADIALSELGL
jgi:dethiobiotin synthetase